VDGEVAHKREIFDARQLAPEDGMQELFFAVLANAASQTRPARQRRAVSAARMMGELVDLNERLKELSAKGGISIDWTSWWISICSGRLTFDHVFMSKVVHALSQDRAG
jgi:hypothetical protein